MRWITSLAFLCIFSAAASAEITVGAAISMSDAIGEISEIYTAKSGGKVRLTFSGSNVIARQIEAGAPIDVFISADEATAKALIRKKLVDPASWCVIARNELVVILPKGSGLAMESAEDLKKIRSIAIADPKAVPAGMYAKRWLEAEKSWPELEGKMISLPNVRAALLVAESGNVDAAITYRSDALSSNRVSIAFPVPAEKTGEIVYPGIIVRESKKQIEAAEFLRFLQSDQSRKVLKKHGFCSP
ncbi:molybdate ABC transporter substrate-binding protein [Luteolibacter algae]|uniref:Molybdate ABC transporter substrate-binding protein n=1 Tax=Luteolibacter algae TaxID=454151 RepID=A0ABW5D2W0_9BACT